MKSIQAVVEVQLSDMNQQQQIDPSVSIGWRRQPSEGDLLTYTITHFTPQHSPAHGHIPRPERVCTLTIKHARWILTAETEHSQQSRILTATHYSFLEEKRYLSITVTRWKNHTTL